MALSFIDRGIQNIVNSFWRFLIFQKFQPHSFGCIFQRRMFAAAGAFLGLGLFQSTSVVRNLTTLNYTVRYVYLNSTLLFLNKALLYLVYICIYCGTGDYIRIGSGRRDSTSLIRRYCSSWS